MTVACHSKTVGKPCCGIANIAQNCGHIHSGHIDLCAVYSVDLDIGHVDGCVFIEGQCLSSQGRVIQQIDLSAPGACVAKLITHCGVVGIHSVVVKSSRAQAHIGKGLIVLCL